MIPKRIDKVELAKLLDAGVKPSKIADDWGVTRAAISMAAKRMKRVVTHVAAIQKAPEVVERKMVTIDQLQKINDYANELLDLVMRWNRGDDVALQILETQAHKVKVGSGQDAEWITEYKFKDPRELALRAMGEIREQLKLQMEMFKSLYDFQAIGETLKIILDEIRHESPECAKRIRDRLELRRHIRLPF